MAKKQLDRIKCTNLPALESLVTVVASPHVLSGRSREDEQKGPPLLNAH